MKKPTLLQRILGILLVPVLLACLVLAASPALAQDEGAPPPPNTYSKAELAQMLAPIALYPDALLSQILMASTYPLEIIEADRWVRRNPNLSGEALDAALQNEDWDPSVKALCHFPSILATMSQKIDQTTDLGNAFLAQEGEVMAMIQELRDKAYAQGNLASNEQQKVIVQNQTIVIEPANPQVIYVPYYDPLFIYGPWWYPAYLPYYWGPPGVYVGAGLYYWPAFYFSFDFGSWCYFDWPHRYIYINIHHRPRYVRHDRWFSRAGAWHHSPRHRRGVAYRDRATAVRFGQAPHRSTDFRRERSLRGFPEGGITVRERDFRAGERTRTERTRTGGSTTLERSRRQQPRVEQRQQQRVEQPQRPRVEQRQQPRVEQRQPRVVPSPAPAERSRQQQRLIQRQNSNRLRQQPRVEQRPQRQQRQQIRENIFNRIDNGRLERQSSQRGRVSRQGGELRAPSRQPRNSKGQQQRFDRGRGRR